jgi:hypothetical protein
MDATTTTLHLSGTCRDTVSLYAPFGVRLQVSARDLGGDVAPERSGFRMSAHGLNPADDRFARWVQAASDGEGTATLTLQFDAPGYAMLGLEGAQGHDVALSVVTLDPDDHGDTAGLATVATLGQPVAVHIDAGGDLDLLAFDLQAGERVRFDAGSAGRGLGLTLHGPDGLCVRQAHGALVVTPELSGRYVLAVAESGAGGGGVSAVVRAERADDDHGDLAATASTLAIGEVATGRVDGQGDAEWFRLQAPGGQPMELRLQSETDMHLRLIDGAGAWIDAHRATDASDGAQVWSLDAPADGTVFVAIPSWTDGPSDYRLQAIPVAVDDHPADPERATWIEFDQAVSVDGDGVADVDVLRWPALAGQRYRVQIEPPEGVQELGWAQLGVPGDTIAEWGWMQAPIDSGAVAVLRYTAPADGQNDLTLTGISAGRTRVTVSPIEADDHSDAVQDATPIRPGEVVHGSLDAGSDRDAFRCTVTPGESFHVRLASTDESGSWPMTLYFLDGEQRMLAAWGFEDIGDTASFPRHLAERLPRDGTLLLVVQSRDDRPHTYALTYEETAPPPDPGPGPDPETFTHHHGELPVALVGLDDGRPDMPPH